jgi:hypothetical protein
MYALINNNAPNEPEHNLTWDPTTMHIRCMCHKIALIVNAGLSALSLKTLPPSKTKESVLGFFPVLGRLVEEEEPEESQMPPADGNELVNESNSSPNLDLGSKSEYGNADDEGSAIGNGTPEDNEDEINIAVKSKHTKSTKLEEITKKVSFLSTRRTCSVNHNLMMIVISFNSLIPSSNR